MGKLVDGKWHDVWYDTKDSNGRFVRKDSSFRDWVRADGSTQYAAESGRYHLYVSLACPWAHRTILFREFKGLSQHIGMSVVHPYMGSQGWSFDESPKTVHDPVHDARFLHQVYTAADPNYTGRVTVPVLWDKKTGTIVNNESSEIIRMFNSEFNALTGNTLDLYPQYLQDEIDELNELIYPTFNNGVYRAGFATTQSAYNEAVADVFSTLRTMEERLADSRYLLGPTITEADWRFFTTLIRFDAVYFGHFKCNTKRIVDFPNLHGYLLDLYQQPGVAQTVDIEYTKQHYYASHTSINPTGIVPVGPDLDFEARHDRASVGS